MTDPPTVAPHQLALQRLYHWERTTPERVVFTQPLGGGALREMTWREVMDETRRMAAHLRSLGLEPGSRIALLAKNTAHWLMADWAIWMAGHVSVPLYPTLAADTIRQILVHSEAKLLFVGKLDGWDGMRPGVPEGLPCIGLPLAPANDFPQWADIVARTAPLAGEPVRDGNELATGMHVFFAESLVTFTADLRRARPTVFFSVPRLWVKFQQGVHTKMPAEKLARLLRIPILRGIVRRKILDGLGLDQCDFAAGGAAPMPPQLLDWYERLGLPIVEVYGMTENCGISHCTGPGVAAPGTVGLPYDGVQSRIDSTSGEIQVKSPGVMMGYYKEPELSRDAMTADGWLRTGDKGALDAKGNLRITGRVKDLFKTSKGKYVAPAPIEDRLVMHGAVEACVVAGANLGQPLGIVMLNAAAVGQAQDAAQRGALEASLGAHLKAINAPLDPHEQLDCLVVVTTPWTVDNGFVTPTFKVKRARVEEVYAARFEQWAGTRRPVIWESA